METPGLSLVLPAYNEGEKIKDVVTSIVSVFEKAGAPLELIVVNNGSADNSEEVLAALAAGQKNVVVVTLRQNQGYGGGILAGLKKAQGSIVGWSDADGQINPGDILKLYTAMQSEGVQAAKAVRVIRHEPLPRRIQSFFFNVFFALLFGNTTRDVNAKPKLVRRALLERLHLSNRRYFIDAEWVIGLNRARIPFVEVPIEFLKRSHGKSKIRFWASLEFVRDLIRYRLHVR